MSVVPIPIGRWTCMAPRCARGTLRPSRGASRGRTRSVGTTRNKSAGGTDRTFFRKVSALSTKTRWTFTESLPPRHVMQSVYQNTCDMALQQSSRGHLSVKRSSPKSNGRAVDHDEAQQRKDDQHRIHVSIELACSLLALNRGADDTHLLERHM